MRTVQDLSGSGKEEDWDEEAAKQVWTHLATGSPTPAQAPPGNSPLKGKASKARLPVLSEQSPDQGEGELAVISLPPLLAMLPAGILVGIAVQGVLALAGLTSLSIAPVTVAAIASVAISHKASQSRSSKSSQLMHQLAVVVVASQVLAFASVGVVVASISDRPPQAEQQTTTEQPTQP